MRTVASDGATYSIMFNANAIRLKACRKRGGLDQAELAFLLGVSCSTVSRFERGLTIPETPPLIAYSLIFDMPATKALPDTTIALRKKLLARCERLHKRLCQSGDRTPKVEFIQSIHDRLSGRAQ